MQNIVAEYREESCSHEASREQRARTKKCLETKTKPSKITSPVTYFLKRPHFLITYDLITKLAH